MNAGWLKTTARYDAMPRRERWLVALTLVAVISWAAYFFYIGPALQRYEAAERGIAGAQARLVDIQTQMTSLNAPDRHPDVAARKELGALRTRLDALSGRMRIVESMLVPPEKMPVLLEEMIGTRKGLRLVSLKTLPVMPFLDTDKPGNDEGKAGEKAAQSSVSSGKTSGLYRHGVEIQLEGHYQDLLTYLERLEKSPLKLLWGVAVLSADQHPQLVLTLTVYSLSMDHTWLVV
jgi:MSHA biogenesis protein MshJ